MADIEKVINSLELLASSDNCKGCCYPYMANGVVCVSEVAKDALELLKEQDNQIHHMGLIIEEHEKEIERVKRLANEMAKIAVHHE